MTKFNGHSRFNTTTFQETVRFNFAEFSKTVNFVGAKFNNADFMGDTFNDPTRFEKVQIDERIRFHNVNIKKVALRHTDLSKYSFVTCKWDDKGGRYRLYDETIFWDDLYMWRFKGDENKISERIHEIEDLYRQMKQKAQDAHNMYDYSFWHYSEKEMMWLRTRLIKSPFKWAVLGLYRLFSGFGEEPLKAFGFLLLFVLLSGWLIGNNGGPVGIEALSTVTLKHLTFLKMKEPLQISNTCGGLLTVFVTRIVVPLQAALFGFALRNRFRR